MAHDVRPRDLSAREQLLRRARTLRAIPFAICIVACSTGRRAADVSSVRASIEVANRNFVEAFRRGDQAAMLANYADRAVVMTAGECDAAGSELDDFLARTSLKEGDVATEDVTLAGDWALETGTFAWTLQPNTGTEVRDAGKYLTVWERQSDGSWKIVRSDLFRFGECLMDAKPADPPAPPLTPRPTPGR